MLFPANYAIPPHTHPYPETVTVISGEVGFGMGEKLDKSGQMFGVGAFLSNLPGQACALRMDWWSAGDHPSAVHGTGWDDYINSADDPRKQ